MSDIFVLLGKDKIWGIFTETSLLYSMYENLLCAAPNLELKIQQIKLNTNTLLHEWTDDAVIKRSYHPKDDILHKQLNSQELVPHELRHEVSKLKVRLGEFQENLKIFKKMLEDGLLTLDSPKEQIPQLLRDKFYIYRDIVRFDVPDEDAFGYFIDRYYYRPLADSDDF